MSHATYCFLFHTDSHVSRESQIEDLKDLFDVYQDQNSDENNYGVALACVFPDGYVHNYIPNSDWRGREQFGKNIQKMEESERWNESIDFAKGCVISECNSALHYITRDYKDDIPFSTTDWNMVITRLVRAMINGLNSTGSNLDYSELWPVEHAIHVVKQLLEMDDHFPFTREIMNPDRTIRALDMREDGNQENIAILFADIHT